MHVRSGVGGVASFLLRLGCDGRDDKVAEGKCTGQFDHFCL